MKKDEILGLVRHALTVLGGALASKGVIAASDVETAVGAVIILIGLVWSVMQKKTQAVAVEEAEATGLAKGQNAAATATAGAKKKKGA